MRKIKIGITAYGNLGRGVETGLEQNTDMELIAVFTRLDPESIRIRSLNVPVCRFDELCSFEGKIDVMILCGGSATDLTEQTPFIAKMFNTVDSFDTHARIPEFYSMVNEAALDSKHVSIISVGWDPGMFSVARVYSNCILPRGRDYTFWGPGVSQGHSDAIRRIKGVKDAKQYTIPVDTAVEKVRRGDNPDLTTRQKHTRLCYVVAEEGADLKLIENEIKTMPNYFDEYETTVKFVSQEILLAEHGKMPHGGLCFRSGASGENGVHKHIIEYSLKLDSNPEFTSLTLLAYARAAFRLAMKSEFGAKTVFDIPPALLSTLPGEELRKRFL
jgi:diaminopimelate dehydrogenase